MKVKIAIDAFDNHNYQELYVRESAITPKTDKILVLASLFHKLSMGFSLYSPCIAILRNSECSGKVASIPVKPEIAGSRTVGSA